MAMQIKFWGVRGSIACPSSKYIIYGGNTSCIEVLADGPPIIFDAGTGIRGLGKSMTARNIEEAFLLMSHTHWDHINGFPFFAPAFNPDFKLNIKAGHLADKGGIKQVFEKQMENPTFPVPLEIMAAKLEFEDFIVGSVFETVPGVTIRTEPLNHPGGATGYRVEYGGKSVCYVTDTEHVVGDPDQNILRLIHGADLVIYDCTYTDDEFPSKIGWGHSTWQEGVRLCQQAEVGQLAIFHHDPDHEDKFMVEVEAAATKMWPHAFVAREDMTVEI